MTLVRRLAFGCVLAILSALALGATSTSASALEFEDILGTWCGLTTDYIFDRDKLTVKFHDKQNKDRILNIDSYEVRGPEIQIFWSKRDGDSTVFYDFDADHKFMAQKKNEGGDNGPRRPFKRCTLSASAAPPSTNYGGGSGGGGGSSGSRSGLQFDDILGTWCGVTTDYIFTRDKLTVKFHDKSRDRVLNIDSYEVRGPEIQIYWSKRDGDSTVFYDFDAKRDFMAQKANEGGDMGPRRPFKRCSQSASAAPTQDRNSGGGSNYSSRSGLKFDDILGTWCGVTTDYVFTRDKLTVKFHDKSRDRILNIDSYDVRGPEIQIYWSKRDGDSTVFYDFDADRNFMAQKANEGGDMGPRRPFKRCSR